MKKENNDLSDRFWEHYFEDYDLLNKLIPYQQLLLMFGKALSKIKGTVLDIGSGTGNFESELSKSNKNIRFVSLDSSESGIRRHKEKLPSAVTILHDIRYPLPFPENQFEAIISNNTLYLLNNNERVRIISEIKRILKPGGLVIISNLVTGFTPLKVYLDHAKKQVEGKGYLFTLVELLKFLAPTIRIIISNKNIKSLEKSNAEFFSPLEQENLLRNAGFAILGSKLVYSGQAEMVTAVK